MLIYITINSDTYKEKLSLYMPWWQIWSRPAPHHNCFTPGERTSSTHWTESWVGTKLVWTVGMTEISLVPNRNQTIILYIIILRPCGSIINSLFITCLLWDLIGEYCRYTRNNWKWYRCCHQSGNSTLLLDKFYKTTTIIVTAIAEENLLP
jgi:hypothetical protein